MTGALTGRVVAVTGATGFLGSHLSLALASAGATVIGVVRSPEKGAWMHGAGVRFRRADLANVDTLTEAFQGVDTVVANAALAVKGNASLAEFRQANVGGVERTMLAVHRAGVRRVLHISSVGVYRVRWFQAMDESTPVRDRFRLDPSLFTTNWRYTLTKAQGEARAYALADELGIDLTVFRPGPIYGSRDVKFSEQLKRRTEQSRLWVPNVGIPMVHAGDIATTAVTALTTEAARGNTYNLGGRTHRLGDVLETTAAIVDRPCRVIRIPMGLGVRFDDTRAERELGLQHRSLEDGLREAFNRR